MRPDYCPMANEPCQALCDKPCSAHRLKINPQPAEPVQEPVGVVTSMVKGGVTWNRWPSDMPDGTTLYADPPQRKPLTEEEIDAEWHELDGEAGPMFRRVLRNFARAIERAHGITKESGE